MSVIINVHKVSISYGKNIVLKDLSFEVREREIYGIVGPNGAGKTTLLRSLSGIIVPDKGEIYVNGINPAQKNPPISMLFETTKAQAGLRLTPIEDLEFHSALYGVDVERDRIKEILKIVGLYEHKEKMLYTFSRGMWQKLYLARVILPDFPIIILDEPWLGLDVISQKETVNILKHFQEMGKTIILSAHEMPLIERSCDRIMLLNHGRKIIEGASEKLFREVGWKYKVIIKGKIKGENGNNGENKNMLFINNLGEIVHYLSTPNLYELEIEPVSLEDVYLKLIGEEGEVG